MRVCVNRSVRARCRTVLRFGAAALALAAALLGPAPARAQVPPGGQVPLGLNVDFNEQAYVDMVQPTFGFSALSGTLTGDANGWPQQDFQFTVDNRYTYAWFSGAPNVDPQMYSTNISGAYTLSFTGQATLGGYGMTISGQTYNSGTNTTTATVTVPNQSGGVIFEVSFSSTKRLPGDTAGDGVTNIHFVRPGSHVDPNFTDLWMNSIKNYNWSALRFMGALGTNSYGQSGSNEAYPYLLQWATDRAIPGNGSVYSHPGVHGIPWEYVILIANATGKDVWINVPVNASGSLTTDTSSYVYQLATLLKNGDAFTGNVGLNSSIHIYLEYSNEMWHLGFPQGPWNKQAATDEVNAGGSNLNYDSVGNADIWRMRRIAKRTIEIGNIFKTVFGDNGTRIRPVINNCFTGFDPDILTYVTKNYGAPGQYLYGISQTGYYTSADDSSVSAILNGEMANSDANRAGYIQSRTIATFYGLHSLTYEAGGGETGNQTPGPPYWGTTDTTLAAKFGAARDPGMQQVETHDLLGNWYPSGGELYMQFSQVGRYSTYGFYGLSEDLTNLTTGKWEGMIQTLGTPAPALAAGTALPTTVNQSVSIPETAPPNGNFTLTSDQPWQEQLVQAGKAGTYKLTVQGKETDTSAPLSVWVDNVQVGTTSLPSGSDGTSSPSVSFTLTAGLHSIFVYGPPASGPNDITTQSGDSLTVTLTAITPTNLTIANSSFETPSLGNGNYRYNPTGGSWTFSSSSGITANNSAWGSPAAPNGTQVAFIQEGGTISQAISGFQSGTNYTLTVQAAQRSSYNPGGNQSVSVYIDSTKVGTITPSSGSFAAYSVGPFTASAGSHTVKFQGTNTSGDSSCFLDAVSLTGH